MIEVGSITDVFSLLICRSDNSMLENAPAVDMKVMVCPAYGDSVEHLEFDYAYDYATFGETVQHEQAITMSNLNDDHTYDSPAYRETVWRQKSIMNEYDCPTDGNPVQHQKAVAMNECDCPTDGNSLQHHQALTVNDDHTYDCPVYESSVQHQKALTVNDDRTYNCPAYENSVQHQKAVAVNEYDCPTDGNSHQALTVNDDRTYDYPVYGNSVQHHQALTVSDDRTYNRPAYENSVQHQKAVTVNEYDCPTDRETVQHQHVATRSGLTGDHTYDNPAYRETKFSLLIHRTDNPMYIPTTEDNNDSISEDPIYEHIVVGPRDHFNFYQNKDH